MQKVNLKKKDMMQKVVEILLIRIIPKNKKINFILFLLGVLASQTLSSNLSKDKIALEKRLRLVSVK